MTVPAPVPVFSLLPQRVKTAASLCQMRKSAGLGTALCGYGSPSLLVKLHDSKLLNQAGDYK